MKPTVISFFTKDWKYPEKAQALKNKCIELGVPFFIEEIPSKGSWLSNTRYKPKFILECLHKYHKVLWVDVDGSLLARPYYLDEILNSYEIAACIHTTMPRPFHVGILGFKLGTSSLSLLEAWCTLCDQSNYTDEECFKEALEISAVQVGILPSSYHFIPKKNIIMPKGTVYCLGISKSESKKEVRKLLHSRGLNNK